MLLAATDDRLPSAPGPSPIPGLGALPHLIRFSRDPIGGATRLFTRYGPMAMIVRGHGRMMTPMGRAVVIATGADLNKEVLTNQEHYHGYALPGPYFPDDETLANARHPRPGRASLDRLRPIQRTLTGLFHVNEDEHKKHRRLLMPAFHKTRIDTYRDDMVALANDLFSEWKIGEERDVASEMSELTLRVATKTLFGEDQGERGVSLSRMLKRWLEQTIHVGMLFRFDVGSMPYRRWLDLTHEIDRENLAIVRAKKAQVEKRARNGEAIEKDMLSMLLAARDEDGAALDEDALAGHTSSIFAAGHETSTYALAWTLLLLSQHPEIACNLHEELEGLLHGEAPTVEQLAKLPLLDAVVKESMRVLPPVPAHPRFVAKDSELGGHFLPARTELFLSIFHMHHDPALFTHPERFDPSRWSTIKPSVYEYNPFSAGPRMCIGAAFAIMEIKIALAILLQRFRVELPPNARVDHRVIITMAPKNGLRMRIRPADRGWRAGARGVRGRIHELVELPS